MNKKTLFIAIQIFLVIIVIIVPNNLAENQNLGLVESNSYRLFDFKTATEVSVDTDFSKPVSLNSSHKVNVSVSFKFELPQFFPKILIGTKIGNWVIFRDINHNMTADIKLNIEKIPEWCDAELEKEILTINNFTTDIKTIKTKLYINISENAPALEKGKIELSAKFETESNWGLLPSSNQVNFTIYPEYIGLINAEFDLPKNTTKLLLSTEKNTTLLPVNITNIGNGESIITIKIKEIQQNWNVSIETTEITLQPGKTSKININITTPKIIERQTMNLTLEITSKSNSSIDIDEKYLQGQTLELNSLELIKEDATEKTDFILITIALIVLLAFLIIIVFFLTKKK